MSDPGIWLSEANHVATLSSDGTHGFGDLDSNDYTSVNLKHEDFDMPFNIGVSFGEHGLLGDGFPPSSDGLNFLAVKMPAGQARPQGSKRPPENVEHAVSRDGGSGGAPDLSSGCARKCVKLDREKLRRDKLNEQFAELASVLDPGRPPKNDKASILIDSMAMVTKLRTEVERLRTEHTALLEESKELTAEKGELREEKNALKQQKDELEGRARSMMPWLSMDPAFLMGAMAFAQNPTAVQSPQQQPTPATPSGPPQQQPEPATPNTAQQLESNKEAPPQAAGVAHREGEAAPAEQSTPQQGGGQQQLSHPAAFGFPPVGPPMPYPGAAMHPFGMMHYPSQHFPPPTTSGQSPAERPPVQQFQYPPAPYMVPPQMHPPQYAPGPMGAPYPFTYPPHLHYHGVPGFPLGPYSGAPQYHPAAPLPRPVAMVPGRGDSQAATSVLSGPQGSSAQSQVSRHVSPSARGQARGGASSRAAQRAGRTAGKVEKQGVESRGGEQGQGGLQECREGLSNGPAMPQAGGVVQVPHLSAFVPAHSAVQPAAASSVPSQQGSGHVGDWSGDPQRLEHDPTLRPPAA